MGFLSALVGGVVGFFIGGPAGAVIGAGLGATKVGEKVVNTVMDFVLQPFMPSIPEVGGGDEAARQQGVLVQTTGSTVSIPVIYGYRKVGGTVVFAETGATNNKYLYVAYVFAEGVVEGLREVYIDDWLLPTDQVGSLNAGSLVTVNADRYKDRVQMRWYPGVYYTNPRSSTVGTTVKGDIFAEAPSFVKEMNYNGLAVLFARYEWKDIKTQADSDSNPFKGNIPEIQVALLGKRVASLLVDTTQTTAYDQNLVRYSTNPAECLLDYLRNPRYGKGLTNDDINWSTFKNAARKCNQTVTYVASGITGPILTLNMVLDTGQTLMSNTKTMLQNFRAYMPYVQGKYKLLIEDAGNTYDILSGSALIVQTFTKDDIVSDITFNGIERSSKYNVVSVTYVDPDQKFSNQTVVYPETESERQIYIDKDGGRENKYDVTLGGVTNYAIAKDFARLIFNKQRRQESCVFTATSKALEIEPGDCIRIQGNLLNFSTDPWRVISVKINNDMTVDLGCVRNPDDIYPYVRAGEEDFVVPTYVPKGSIIYFPTSDNRVPLGLVPPMYAVFPPDAVPVMTNPVATNPDLLGGGGVGGGSNGGSTAGPVQDAAPTTPTPATNTTPAVVPPPPPFAAILKLKSVKATILSNNTANFTLTFTQPSDGLYEKATVWWRLNQFSPWTEINLDTRPGGGGDIPVNISGLPGNGVNQYEFYARAYATDGRASNHIERGVFGLKQDQTTGLFVGTGSSVNQQISEGWAIPSSTVPTAPVYNDDIEYFAIKTKLAAGATQDPRRLSVSIQQLVNTINKPLNTLINGFTVYYRFKGDTYWSYEKFNYPANYTFGLLEFDLAGDFGAKGTLGASQQYEFLVRLSYANGTAAEKQMGPAVGSVEVNGTGLINFDVFGTDARASAPSQKSVTIPVGFDLKTVDQAPQTAPAGSDIVPVVRIVADPTYSKLTFKFTPPTGTSRFRGYNIRYREVVPGLNIEFTTVKVSPAANNTAGGIDVVIQDSTYSHGRKYEWAITALYSLNGTITEATYSLYGKATVNFGNRDLDLYALFFPPTQPVDTVVALGNLRASFPALPTVNPKSWVKKQLLPVAAATTTYADVNKVPSTSNYYLNSYFQFKFQPDSTSDSLVIYRRVYNAYGAQRVSSTSTAKYFGLGAWEKATVALADLATVDGWKVLNVRGPLSPNLFEPYYGISAGKTLFRSVWGPSPSVYPTPGTFAINNVYPYYGVGNNALTSATVEWCEYLFVLKSGSTEAVKGLLIRDFNTSQSGTAYLKEVDGFINGVSKDTIVNVADYNTFENGYKRNINEAITNVPVAALHFSNNNGTGPAYVGQFGVPNAPNYTSSYSIFLQQPTDGSTVY